MNVPRCSFLAPCKNFLKVKEGAVCDLATGGGEWIMLYRKVLTTDARKATASTTATMVVGDALAIALFNRRGLDREDYARFHPGGQLGRKLMKVTEVMRTGRENPIAREDASLKEVVVVMTKTPGRPGAASIVDKKGRLVGFFTDGDLRRLLEEPDFSVGMPVRDVMHRNPKTIRNDQLIVEAESLLRKHKIDNIPVLDSRGRPVGLVDVQDLLSTRVV